MAASSEGTNGRLRWAVAAAGSLCQAVAVSAGVGVSGAADAQLAISSTSPHASAVCALMRRCDSASQAVR